MHRRFLIPLLSAVLLPACTSPPSRPVPAKPAPAVQDVPLEAAAAPPESERRGAPYHSKPIVEEDGRTLLWAGEDQWFDMTDSAIDPATFQYGIGKDTIPSIDEPVFVDFDDERLAASRIDMDSMVLGVLREGVAKAYPVSLMDGHEVVNDEFGGEPYAVLW